MGARKRHSPRRGSLAYSRRVRAKLWKQELELGQVDQQQMNQKF